MTFISYAQNFEDVMLWRALGHVEEGFYIDVGAWDPDLDSVTKAFYDRGWRGINIEPNPEYHQKLHEARENDINLDIALSDEPGSGTFYIVDNPGLSTMDEGIARQHAESGFTVDKKSVNVTTLDRVWQEWVAEGQNVHFLKVDVEGLESRVLRGNDWVRHRPWIVVVEATVPMSQQESYSGWEPWLFQHDYMMAYADGLNRFYLAREHWNLREALRYPPNYFDDFKQFAMVRLESELQASRERAQEAENKAREFRSRALAEREERERIAKENSNLRAEIARTRAEVESLKDRLHRADAQANTGQKSISDRNSG